MTDAREEIFSCIFFIIVNSCSAGLALHFSGNGAEVATGHGYMMTAIVYSHLPSNSLNRVHVEATGVMKLPLFFTLFIENSNQLKKRGQISALFWSFSEKN
ncbi:MAG: hypothetical protein IKF22_11240 [Lachnospiraceae bacterium]|nr:hypothetical protein [Lachnospiraceae bacterium]MBR3277296.1 hypothetical protein [Lachnospiraceae bacterium]